MPAHHNGFLQELLKNLQAQKTVPEPEKQRLKIQRVRLPEAAAVPDISFWYFPGDMPVACLKATQKLLLLR